jgi:hypothetical protein
LGATTPAFALPQKERPRDPARDGLEKLEQNLPLACANIAGAGQSAKKMHSKWGIFSPSVPCSGMAGKLQQNGGNMQEFSEGPDKFIRVFWENTNL